MKFFLASAMIALGWFTAGGSARAEECGNVSIAEMNWASAAIAAQVDRLILETGYGCKVTIVAGDTIPTFESMIEKAEPDLAPEFWGKAVHARLDAALKEGRLIEGAEILQDGAIEGWWIPKFLADAHPDIKTVTDALKHPELFPGTKDAKRGAIYNCPPDWSCHVTTANLFTAVAARDKGFDIVDTTSAADLDGSIAEAFRTKTGWLGYYWAPTAVLGKYEMVKLSFGVPHNKLEWDNCTSVPNCPTAQVNSYPTAQAYTLVTRQFSEKAAVAMDYVKNRKWTNGVVNGLLAWQDENKASNADTARHFLKQNEDLWTQWLTPDVAAKVKAAL